MCVAKKALRNPGILTWGVTFSQICLFFFFLNCACLGVREHICSSFSACLYPSPKKAPKGQIPLSFVTHGPLGKLEGVER